jgi:hypothetical protein
LHVEATSGNFAIAIATTAIAALLSRIIYLQFFHPLSKFPGPWYATSFSVVGALISIKQKEPEFIMHLVKKYGSESHAVLCTLQFPSSTSSHRYPTSCGTPPCALHANYHVVEPVVSWKSSH